MDSEEGIGGLAGGLECLRCAPEPRCDGCDEGGVWRREKTSGELRRTVTRKLEHPRHPRSSRHLAHTHTHTSPIHYRTLKIKNTGFKIYVTVGVGLGCRDTPHKYLVNCRGGVWLLQLAIQKLNRGFSSGCISMFSVNLTFDKTLMMRLCFSAKIATFWAINV